MICTQVGLLPIQSAGLEVAGRQVNKNLFERSSLVLCKLKKEDEKKNICQDAVVITIHSIIMIILIVTIEVIKVMAII